MNHQKRKILNSGVFVLLGLCGQAHADLRAMLIPLPAYQVGTEGVAVDSLEDMEQLFEGYYIPIDMKALGQSNNSFAMAGFKNIYYPTSACFWTM